MVVYVLDKMRVEAGSRGAGVEEGTSGRVLTSASEE